MPARATKRGAERTPLGRDADVLICGASFAGLAVARELAGTGARVMLLDRYEVGERATSACAAPTAWLDRLRLGDAIRQTFPDLVVHAADGRSFRWPLPFTFSTFDYRRLCSLLRAQGDAEFETATVTGATRGATTTVHTDRGDLRAPLVVDALGWRRVLGGGPAIQPPNARLSRGLEVHPRASGAELELWLDPRYARAGYAWAFPAGTELRVGVGSFDPRDHVKEPTLRLADEVGVAAERFQGNWIPHELRSAVEDGVAFAGDSAGHCLPTTAEGIRPALYFGLALGRELRAVHEGRRTREEALSRYDAFSASHARAYRRLLRVQHLVGRVNPTPLMPHVLRALSGRRILRLAFSYYRDICPPAFAGDRRRPRTRRSPSSTAA
jgi:flavin-dependent dehydrogenase